MNSAQRLAETLLATTPTTTAYKSVWSVTANTTTSTTSTTSTPLNADTAGKIKCVVMAVISWIKSKRRCRTISVTNMSTGNLANSRTFCNLMRRIVVTNWKKAWGLVAVGTPSQS
jgi:hypothetical protein